GERVERTSDLHARRQAVRARRRRRRALRVCALRAVGDLATAASSSVSGSARRYSLSEVRLPTLRQGRNSQRAPDGYDIVTTEGLRDIQTRDVCDAHAVWISIDQGDRVSSPDVSLLLNGQVETGPAAGEKPFDHVIVLESDPEFVTGQARLRDDDACGAD